MMHAIKVFHIILHLPSQFSNDQDSSNAGAIIFRGHRASTCNYLSESCNV